MTRYVGSKDMARLQREALEKMDYYFKAYRDRQDPNVDIHLMKLAEAISTDPGPLIEAEASKKGVQYDEVRLNIVRKALAKSRKLAPVEEFRQQMQDRIRASTNPVQLKKALQETETALEQWRN